jgi:DNA-binding transcriptional ArsR family regulator
MDYDVRSVYRNESLRTAVGVAVGLAVLSFLTDSAIDVVPIAVLSVGMLAYSVADDRYSLPDGTGRAVYGAGVSLAGAAFSVAYSAVGIGGALAAAGLWFVLDGTTAVLYGEADAEHEYVSEADEGSKEVMSRMMALRGVYTAVQDSPEPRTPEELAEDTGLAEPRVESALDYLEDKGRVTKEGDRYRPVPQRWGKATPIVEFLVWLPRRLFRPFYRITGGQSWR